MATPTTSPILSTSTQQPLAARPAVLGGAVTGTVAGLAMAGYAMVASLVNGNGFLTPVELIAAAAFGQGALTPSVVVLATGLVLHMVTSAALGALFGYAARSVRSATASVGLAVAFGVAVWAATLVVLPGANPVQHARVSATPISWFMAHAVFGLALGLARGRGKRAV